MARAYAQGTSVPVERSMMELRRTIVQRYKCTGFQLVEEGSRCGVGFVYKGRPVRIVMNLPSQNEKRFRLTPTGRERGSDDLIYKAWDDECRRIWRALNLAVLAKLELVENGVEFEKEFMPYLLTSDNRVVADYALKEIVKKLDSGQAPSLLPWNPRDDNSSD